MNSTLYIGMNLLTTAVLCGVAGLIFGFGWGFETAQTKQQTAPEIEKPQAPEKVSTYMPLPLLLEIEAEQERIAA